MQAMSGGGIGLWLLFMTRAKSSFREFLKPRHEATDFGRQKRKVLASGSGDLARTIKSILSLNSVLELKLFQYSAGETTVFHPQHAPHARSINQGITEEKFKRKVKRKPCSPRWNAFELDVDSKKPVEHENALNRVSRYQSCCLARYLVSKSNWFTWET